MKRLAWLLSLLLLTVLLLSACSTDDKTNLSTVDSVAKSNDSGEVDSILVKGAYNFDFLSDEETVLPPNFVTLLSSWEGTRAQVFELLNVPEPEAADINSSLYYISGSIPDGEISDNNTVSDDGDLAYGGENWALKLYFLPGTEDKLTGFEYETVVGDAESAKTVMDQVEDYMLSCLGDPIDINEGINDPDDYFRCENQLNALTNLSRTEQLADRWDITPEDAPAGTYFRTTLSVRPRYTVDGEEQIGYILRIKVATTTRENGY